MSEPAYAAECGSNDDTARYQRRMQFCGISQRVDLGPQRETFYACEEHRESLNDVMSFIPIADEPIKPVEEDHDGDPEHQCDFCREGGYEC